MIRHMIERAERVVVLADSSKFGRNAFAHIGELSLADSVITETAPAAEIGAALAEAGVELLIPEAAEDRGAETDDRRADSGIPG
jgi:DeoR/GlpR family transcriptional regulator of sugar metabolism